MSQIKVANKMLDELLLECNNNTALLKEYIKNVPLFKEYIELCTNSIFPEVDTDKITYIKYGYHRSMAGSILLNRGTLLQLKSVIYNRRPPETHKLSVLKELLSMLHADEATLLVAILVKDITTIYPNLTHEVLCEALGK